MDREEDLELQPAQVILVGLTQALIGDFQDRPIRFFKNNPAFFYPLENSFDLKISSVISP